MLKKLLIASGCCLFVLATAGLAKADTITYATPTNSTESGGNSVDASAVFTTGTGTVTITLNDLLVNPTTVAQLISDLDFTLSNSATSGTLASISGNLIDVNSGGSVSTPTPGTASLSNTDWKVNNNVSGGLQLDALGSGQPSQLIIGPGPYSNANGSIAGNGPHNPFIDGSATFLLDISGVTVNTDITSAIFSFGTTAGDDVTGTPQTPPVPEPSPLLLLGTGLALLAGGLKLRQSAPAKSRFVA